MKLERKLSRVLASGLILFISSAHAQTADAV